MGRAGGINDWYLDRQGLEIAHGDDDRGDKGPDIWLDRVTGPAAPRGSRVLLGTDRRVSNGAPPKAPSARQDTERRSVPAPRARGSQTVPGSTDQALARRVMTLQKESSKTLSYAEVVRRLRAEGWRVTKVDLQRAFRVTNTVWGGRPKTAATTTLPRTPARQQATKTTSQRAGTVRAVRIIRASGSIPSTVDSPSLETARRRQDEAEAEAIANILRLSRWKVARPAAKQQPPTSRTVAHSDRNLAREVALLQSRSTQRLSDAEVVRKLQVAGWQVSRTDVQRATRANATQRGAPQRQRKGEPVKPQRESRRQPTTLVRIDNSICEGCGVAVSTNGYCRCS